ncbi:uncharacterized protein B0H18DRAFT_479012 [Fomitopsis serialis]|uniref:uncharacterized protein n=1 Tax=Fomitopsis serialis TaxID=139415 RepID=UPI00200876F3|nr:uncharacterized protein B0H18DRAFT_479012 [Neoantrodia serialis]KAH9923054.1 hypothetical protein B0H18DRAFT_479012 [Neoantrodia serialis]
MGRQPDIKVPREVARHDTGRARREREEGRARNRGCPQPGRGRFPDEYPLDRTDKPALAWTHRPHRGDHAVDSDTDVRTTGNTVHTRITAPSTDRQVMRREGTNASYTQVDGTANIACPCGQHTPRGRSNRASVQRTPGYGVRAATLSSNRRSRQIGSVDGCDPTYLRRQCLDWMATSRYVVRPVCATNVQCRAWRDGLVSQKGTTTVHTSSRE